MNDTITNNATSSSQQQEQQQHQQHPEDSEELLVTSTSSSTTPPNNLTTNAVYPTSVIASSSTSPNSSSSSPFSNSNIPAVISTGASPTSSTAIIPTIRPFNQPSETESSGGESGSPENSPPLNVNTTAGASLIAISPSTSSAGFCQIVSSSTENISPLKISSLVNYDLDSEDEYDEEDEYLEEIEQQQRRQREQQHEQQQQQQQQLKMVNSTNTGSDSGEVCILPSSSSSNYEKSKENPSISPQSINTQRLSGLTTRSSRRKFENESIGTSNSSHLGHRNLNLLKNQTQPPSIIIKKTSSNTPSNQQSYNSTINTASSSSLTTAGIAGPSSSTSFTSASYCSSSINLIKSDNLLNSSSNRLGINNDNEQSQQIDNRLINNNNSNNNNSNSNNNIESTFCLSGVSNCINSSNNNSNNNNNCSGQNSNNSGSSSNTSQSAKISIKIANKYNCINNNLESQQNSLTKSKLNSNELNNSCSNLSNLSIAQPTISSPFPSTSTLNCNNPSDTINVEQRKVEPLKINLNRHDSPIPKITIKPIIKPIENENSLTNIGNLNNASASGGSIHCSSNIIPIPKLTIKQSSSSNQNDTNSNSTTLSNIAAVTNPSMLSEPHILPKLTIKTSSSDISGNAVIQSVIVPKLTIKMDSSGSISTNSNTPNTVNRVDHGSSSSRSSSTSPSCSSRSSPSPTQERNNILKSGINKTMSGELPPLPKLKIKTSGDCVETIITKNSIQQDQQKEQHQQECHIVGSALSPTIPKLTIKTYPKPSSSTIISSCSTPTLNAILTQTDGSIVPKLTIKPIVINSENLNEGIIPKLTIKANPNIGQHNNDSPATVYSSELHSVSTVSSKNSVSSGNLTNVCSKEQHSIPKLTIRTKSITNITPLDTSTVDGENDDKIPKFSIKHTSHLDNSQTVPKLTIHVNEPSLGIYSASSIGGNTTNNISNNNSNERIVPKLKISLQDKTSSVDNQHYYHHTNTDDAVGNNSKTFPKIILKPPYHQSEPNSITKQTFEEDKVIPKLTIINSGIQTSIITEKIDSLNNSEKIPKIVIKQTPSATTTTAITENESLDEVDKSVPKITKKDKQFCEIENVPQFFDRSNPKVILKDIRLEKNRKDTVKQKNTIPASPLLEKKLKTQKAKGSSNKRLSPTLQFLNTDYSTSQDNEICISNNNCQSDLESNCDVIINQNQLQSNEILSENIIVEQSTATNSTNRLDDCIQYNSDDVSIKSDEISHILDRQSQFSVVQNHQEQQQQPMETVDLTDTPSPGASPNPQYDSLNQDKYNMSKRLNNQLLYDILKSAKHDMNTEKNRTNNYAHILNGQHMENERNKIDDILMQNDITNDSNSFIVNHFQEDPNCIGNDVTLQNNNTEKIKECHRSSSNSLKRKTEDLLYESGGNGDCTNEIPYKRTKDNLIGANQIIETSTTSLSSFEVCLKMTPANCLPNMNNITDTISLPDSESDNIMLCDTGTNSLDGTKFCTVTDFESIKSIDDDEDEVQIIQSENKQIVSNEGLKHLQNNINSNKIKEVVDLTDEIICTKESSVIVQNAVKIMQQRDQSNLISEGQFPLHAENLFNSQQSNRLNLSETNHKNQEENLLYSTNQNIQDKIINKLLQNNDRDSNSLEEPESNKSLLPPSVKRGRGRPRKIVTVEKEINLKVRRRTQVSMMLEDALHSQVYKDRSKINSDIDNANFSEENNQTNLISSNGSEFNINPNQNINDEISLENPQTPEKPCSQDDISQTPPIFATPLEFCTPRSPNNLFNESFESQGSDMNEEATPSRRRGRGRGNKSIGSARGRGSRGGRGRGSRGGRGRPSITPRRPIGGLTHTPNPDLIRERHYSQESKARVLFDPLNPSSIQVFEEDTRMSAESSTVPRQSDFLNDENSQSSVLSSTSILDQSVSSVKKRSKLEVLDPDGKTEYPVERIAEYDWPPPKGCCPDRNRETYMIQEQIAEYLGIKSFKRKYPDLFRRQIDMEERNYLRDKGLVTEKMCDLGITAVLAYEALDIMYLDFIEKYEEYKNYLRQKHLKEIETKQKGLSHNNVDKSLQTRDRALQSASKWNTHFNNERKEERRMCIDLQTYVINKPLPKTAAGAIACIANLYRPTENLVPKKPISSYPVALVPGQFGENYKVYSAEELRSFPLNTVTHSPILESFKQPSVKIELQETENKIEIQEIKENNECDLKDIKDIKPITTVISTATTVLTTTTSTTTISTPTTLTVTTTAEANVTTEALAPTIYMENNDSDESSSVCGSESYSDSDTNSDSESSDEDVAPNGIKCTVCHLPQNKNLKGKPEVCIECYTCRKLAHPSCIEMSTNVLNRVLSYNWQCAECKCCIKCKRYSDRNKMLFCEQCDRAFHIYCIQIKTLPDKRWSCERCSVCRRCGATDPAGILSSSSSSSHLMLSPHTQQQLKKNQRRPLKWVNEYRIDHLTRLREHSNMLCIPCSKLKSLSSNAIDNNNSLNLLTTTQFTKQTVQGITTNPETVLTPTSTVITSSSIMTPTIITTSIKNTDSFSSNNNNNVLVTNNSSNYITTTIQSNS